ncbi:AbiV family abortive infection protein [Yeosuana marina]|uniref:AbiV family abortive infection protein n=1 Tax=Yeosuana marina TaxID=1565536 RepID=UPI00141E3DC5|nr:AbiV family abortive infection protein [Yeosuana marina]
MMREKGNKSFMNLSKEECLVVSKETFRNAKNKHSDALILAKNNSYGMATSTLMLSLEENMKAVILFLDGNGFEFRKRVKGIKYLFVNHKLRYPLGLILSGFNIFGKDLIGFIVRIASTPSLIKDFSINEKEWEGLALNYISEKINQLSEEIIWFSNADYLRQDGMYVDYDNVLKTPLSIDKEDFNNILTRVSGISEFIDKFLSIFGQSNESTDAELKTQVKKLQKQLISEKGYDKIGMIVTKMNGKGNNLYIDILKNLQEFKKDINDDF